MIEGLVPPAVPIAYLPADAPFTAPQRAWLNGFLAGFFAAQQPSLAVPAPPAVTLTVLYGSQTGTAEALARSLAREAKQRGCAVTVAAMDELEVASLLQTERLLVLCSTHGDGEPPDSARAFYDALHSAKAPSLAHLTYAVLALGDTNYEKFCQCGRDLDERFAALGAQRLIDRVDCDIDVDEPFVRWRTAVLGRVLGDAAPAVAPAPAAGARALGPAGRVASLVRVIANDNLNGAGSEKETRHVVLGAGQPGSALAYEPGDALAILPFNDPGFVAELVQAAGFAPDAEVVDQGDVMPLATALSERFTIGKLAAPTLRRFADRCGDERLLALFAPERAEELHAFLHGRELIDLLLAAPHAFADPAELLAVLPRLAPRLYSIASSPRAHAAEVHLTVSAVRYEAHGRRRLGVCSTFLADRAAPGALMLAYVQENRRFRLPSDSTRPIIMIGPGTGIAPFRAFLADRLATGATGRNWLFFGDRCAGTDYLYRDELETWHTGGHLTRLDTAFSRDQSEKIYVQDRMRERSREVWAWLEAGAHVYVCGDAARMARDVEHELSSIIAREGSVDADGAAAYLNAMRKEQRYQRDVY